MFSRLRRGLHDEEKRDVWFFYIKEGGGARLNGYLYFMINYIRRRPSLFHIAYLKPMYLSGVMVHGSQERLADDFEDNAFDVSKRLLDRCKYWKLACARKHFKRYTSFAFCRCSKLLKLKLRIVMHSAYSSFFLYTNGVTKCSWVLWFSNMRWTFPLFNVKCDLEGSPYACRTSAKFDGKVPISG